MKKPVFFFLFLLHASFIFSQTTETDTVYSSHVKDRFIITIRKPPGFTPAKPYHHVYLTDGSIGMGDYVLGRKKSWAAEIPSSCIIIAISHTGNWHDKRPRDFIPADISRNTEKNFGRADLFYLFLKNELIPSIEKKIPLKKSKAFIGHSFGGLFCLYTLFREDKLFDRHFAISPSCWANYYELEKIEMLFAEKNQSLRANLTIYVGGLEFLNKVLPCSRSFYQRVSSRNYRGFAAVKEEIGNANHFSIRKPAVDRIFDSLKD